MSKICYPDGKGYEFCMPFAQVKKVGLYLADMEVVWVGVPYVGQGNVELLKEEDSEYYADLVQKRQHL